MPGKSQRRWTLGDGTVCAYNVSMEEKSRNDFFSLKDKRKIEQKIFSLGSNLEYSGKIITNLWDT